MKNMLEMNMGGGDRSDHCAEVLRPEFKPW